jgi:hypothetical protein
LRDFGERRLLDALLVQQFRSARDEPLAFAAAVLRF